MKNIAAYLLAVLGGNPHPNYNDIERILSSVGITVDKDRVELLLQQLEGKDINDVIAGGLEKLSKGAPATVPIAVENYVVHQVQSAPPDDDVVADLKVDDDDDAEFASIFD